MSTFTARIIDICLHSVANRIINMISLEIFTNTYITYFTLTYAATNAYTEA
jgi:hypothetical protein